MFRRGAELTRSTGLALFIFSGDTNGQKKETDVSSQGDVTAHSVVAVCFLTIGFHQDHQPASNEGVTKAALDSEQTGRMEAYSVVRVGEGITISSSNQCEKDVTNGDSGSHDREDDFVQQIGRLTFLNYHPSAQLVGLTC